MGMDTLTYILYLFSHILYLVHVFTFIYRQTFDLLTTTPYEVPCYFIIERGPAYSSKHITACPE